MNTVHTTYLSRLDELSEIATAVNKIGPELSIDPDFLVGARAHEVDPAVPDEIFTVFLDSIDGSSDLRFCTPSFNSAYFEKLFDRSSTESDGRREYIFTPPLFERLRTSHPDSIIAALDDSNGEILLFSSPPSFGLWLADDRKAGVMLFTDNGIVGILVNDTDEALEWGRNKYRTIRQAASPVPRTTPEHR